MITRAVPSVPSTMKAVIVNGNSARVATDRPIPTLRPDYILVKVEAVALNPTDVKHVSEQLTSPEAMMGCDYSGIVVEVGPKVRKSFKPGDRIAGMVHGGNLGQPEDGCFAEYAVVKGDIQMKIPDNLSFEAAATLGVGIGTCGQGLYQQALKLNVPLRPITDNTPVLIYGGSSATGSLAIQLAKLSGYKVLTTCSPHNFDFVKSLGADEVFNYRDADCGQQIRDASNDNLKLAWDTISVEDSAAICAASLTSRGGDDVIYGYILPGLRGICPRSDISNVLTSGYTIFGEPLTKRGTWRPASPEDHEWAIRFFGGAERLLGEGTLKPHPDKVNERGLEGLLEGLKDMQDGKVSGCKYVYRVAETPENTTAEITL